MRNTVKHGLGPFFFNAAGFNGQLFVNVEGLKIEKTRSFTTETDVVHDAQRNQIGRQPSQLLFEWVQIDANV
jgi:hypothetical protein